MVFARFATIAACCCLSTAFAHRPSISGADELSDQFRDTQKTALAEVSARGDELRAVNQSLWRWAEVGLEERQSSRLLSETLEQAGFRVERNIAGMPTAFIATFGEGRPIIGLLAEYDALPSLSQQVAPERMPLVENGAGHGCGHSGLGAGALGAALAVKAALQKHKLPGTIRLYGTPAEETVIGKVYMTLAGRFDDLDACLHWHPSDKNGAWASSSKAIVSAKFTFTGSAAHASVSPDRGASALDAVELMNVGANFMREHLPEDARVHYVIVDGGGQPNVVPPTATVWYYVRADSHQDVERHFRWLEDIARGAALMTRTEVAKRIDTDCHELIANGPLSILITQNLRMVGAPTFSDDEMLFARRLQQPLIDRFGEELPIALDGEIHEETPASLPSKGSTDVGDISWRAPTGGLRTTCFAAGSPGHSWQNVASIGSSIGEKGLIFAAQTLAVTALDLFENRELLDAAKADWKSRMKGRTYNSLIPHGQAPPAQIR